MIDYKEKYRALKRNFKFLVYENECYQEEIRNLQRKLLKLSRDKNFLLDRLLFFENVEDSSDESEATVCSDENGETKFNKGKSMAVKSELNGTAGGSKPKRRRSEGKPRVRKPKESLGNANDTKQFQVQLPKLSSEMLENYIQPHSVPMTPGATPSPCQGSVGTSGTGPSPSPSLGAPPQGPMGAGLLSMTQGDHRMAPGPGIPLGSAGASPYFVPGGQMPQYHPPGVGLIGHNSPAPTTIPRSVSNSMEMGPASLAPSDGPGFNGPVA